MLIVRPALESDLDALFELIEQPECGLTTLTLTRDELAARLEQSRFAFTQRTGKPTGKPYVFVMEDLSIGKVVGTCAIYSKVGGFEPFYVYHIEKSVHRSEELGVYKEIDTLHLLLQHDGPTEVGGLFLSHDYWGQGHGRLLSLSRFLFFADFRDRFESEIIAEMRGVLDENGESPLWSALGAHFFQIDFPKAEKLTAKSKKFIADLMPRHPIYIPLLPKAAQAVIGDVHHNTRPALALLKSEGFEFRNHVDIFDGGPTMHCHVDKLRTVRESQRGVVGSIVPDVENGQTCFISNCRLDFRVCEGPVHWLGNDTAEIDQNTALRLELKVGDPVRSVVPTA